LRVRQINVVIIEGRRLRRQSFSVRKVFRETHRIARWIKEVIWIRKITPTMNRDEGATDPGTCGTVCTTRHLASNEDTVPGEGHRW